MAGGVVAVVVDGEAAPRAVTVLTGLLALLVVLGGRWVDWLDTAVHEGGHAFAAYLAGRRVVGVWMAPSGAGLTATWGRHRGFGLFLTGVAGYTGPPLAGVCSAALLAAGKATAVLILAGLGFVALLLVTFGGFGRAVVLGMIGTLVLVGRFCPGWVQLWYACFLTWLLLLSGPRSVLVMHRARRRGVSGSDADMLAEVTHLPAPLWVLAFGAFSLWCALRGAVLLVG
ncbi:M50 family metallopeptidase [Frankia sp. AgKG'84/4]|uniref:M50 family metallopeptidase n=1 Tax=Frankia sp. AgKG'84/4 TaxID=573490 RepID=UPI0020108242|nr:M50 family metallopeptidase [Frankia sp. AgKG'84/4]MCL9794094.1 M50 family metallopeptidase [Frankia sp. AgKG'84/4]